MILYVICQLVCMIDFQAHTSFVYSILSLKLGVTEGTAQQQLHIFSEICSLKLSFLFSLSDLTWMASRGLGGGEQRQPGRPVSLSIWYLVGSPDYTVLSCSKSFLFMTATRLFRSTWQPRFFSVQELHVPQMLYPAADQCGMFFLSWMLDSLQIEFRSSQW